MFKGSSSWLFGSCLGVVPGMFGFVRDMFWELFGACLGPCLGPFGVSWNAFGPSGGYLAYSSGSFGVPQSSSGNVAVILGTYGGSLGSSWSQLGSHNALESDPTAYPKMNRSDSLSLVHANK